MSHVMSHVTQHESARDCLRDVFIRLYGQYDAWPSAAKTLYNAERKTLYAMRHEQHRDFTGRCSLRTCPLVQTPTPGICGHCGGEKPDGPCCVCCDNH